MPHEDSVLDNYGEYEYKKLFTRLSGQPNMLPSWIPDEDLRRLRSYQILEAFYRNKGREWLPGDKSQTALVEKVREYGDAELLVETALSSLLGENWRITTDGADEEEGEEATLAQQQQEILEGWAETVNFDLKLHENERQSIKLGDGVYALGIDDRGRIKLTVYDPGFYFPVLDASVGSGDEFPRKVHIAWEWEDVDEDGKNRVMVTRHTWELVNKNDPDVEQWEPYSVPWSEEDPEDVCIYSNLTVPLEDIGKVGEDTLFTKLEEYAPDEEVNMAIDFIPVVHIPNTIAGQHHFGRSVLANITQLLDDIHSNDTDLQRASALTGAPPIVVTGRGAKAQEEQAYGPGTILNVGDGTATVLDTSRSLDALLKMKDSLLSRLSINSRTPEALLGRVKPNEVPSGIALTLGFTPHKNMITQMRTVRRQKYRLLFKFVLRLMRTEAALAYEDFDSEGRISRLTFGSFLPADIPSTVEIVARAVETKTMSRDTAVKMLLAVGVPSESWPEEIQGIQETDFEGAAALVGITADPNTALEYLGLPTIPDLELEDEERDLEEVDDEEGLQ